MPGGDALDAGMHTITYCVVPFDLAPKLHERLREHFADDPTVEVVVELRAADRRSVADRRAGESAERPGERRRIRAESGRRVSERRAPVLDAAIPPLPRLARRYADRLTFVERLAPGALQSEDTDTARLVTRFQGGESEVFSTIYLRYFDRVFSYLRTLLHDAHSAEDLAQEVFTRVLVNLPAYERRRQPFRGWLFTIARNQAMTELRARGRLQPESPAQLDRRREEEGEPERAALEVISWLSDSELLLFVERLPITQREVILLRFMLGLSHAEIAEALGLTPVNVRKLQHRGLAFLRKRLTAIGRAPERRERRRGAIHRPVQAIVLRERRFALFA